MIIYAYTFPAYVSHSEAQYKNRIKVGQTTRDATIRIDEQDTTAVSERPIILRTWDVQTAVTGDVDDKVREILIRKHGCINARTDKQREWIIFPHQHNEDNLDLIETAISELGVVEETKAFIKVELRPEQQAPVDETDTKTHGWWSAACGLGKTFTELAIHEKYLPAKNEVNLVISSGIDLVEQICDEFMSHTVAGLKRYAWTPVLVHSKADSEVNGIKPTTDASVIAAAIKATKKPVCVFVTYDSVREAISGIEKAGCTVNVKIMDEAHRAVTIGQTKFSWAARVIGKREYAFTATPRFIKG